MLKKRINYSAQAILKKVFYYIIIFILTYFSILFSSKNYEKLQEARTVFFANTSFAFKIFSIPFIPFSILQNTNDIKAETEALKKIFLETEIKREEIIISGLKNLKKAVFDINLQNYGLIFIAPSYYSSGGFLTDVIFNSNKVTEEELFSIKPNMAVISEFGLYGRISAISGKKMSIISIYNSLSRIPVYTKTSKVYGIAGGMGNQVSFLYPSEDYIKLIEGEEVLTSGENDLIISGIPFGRIEKTNDKFIIVPFSKTRPQILAIINKGGKSE